MGRLLFLLVVIAASIYLIRKIYLTGPEKKNSVSKQDQNQLMKRCEHCELHIPASQSVQDHEGRYFCSAEHKDAFHQS